MRPIEFHPKEEIAAGSALDRSGWLPRERAGDSGRVIVNAQGHFAFEKEPERAIRFFANCDNPDSLYGRKGFTFGHPISQIDTKEKTRAYVAKLRRAGYNMTRLHGVDGRLMLWAKEEAVFDPVMLDRIDYFIHCLKESGIYINFDLMSTRLGYLPGNAADAKLRPELTQKLTIHADPAARADWRKGVEKLLTRVNPYTKTRLIDDPVLAMVVCYNEQEFGLSRPRNWALLAPSWQAFLQKNHGDIGGLNRAWGTTYAAFAAIPLPTPDQAFRKDAAGCDAARYFTKLESDTDDWYRRQLREIGYRGLTANHNMSRSRRYLVLRDAFDFVASNGYHDHPHGGFGPGCSIRQSSSVGSGNMIIRSFISTRLAGKPMLTTEQDQAFWNRYRYEFAFTCGAYAAFQDFDGMTHFAANQTVIPIEKIRTFVSMIDPINHANEFLNFFLFVRGDVATSPHRIRLQLDREEMFTDGTASDGLNASQVRLALVTGFTPEVTGSGKTPPPSGENEIVLGTSGSSQAAAVDDGYASLADSGTGEFNFGDFAGELKRRGFLLKENRTDPKAEIFETDTGELLLDVSKRLLTVNTERLQGVAAEAGTRLRLKDFEVEAMSRRGCLAAVSLDGLKPLREAERLMLVYATNALNSKMIFDDKEETTLRSLGELPVLLETGKIRVKIRNRNAANLRVWSLSMEGKRLEEITPVSRENGELRIEIDTAKLQQGPAVFFELAQ